MMIENNLYFGSSYIFQICLDEFTTEKFKGLIYTSIDEKVLSFNTFDDFIIQMDHHMDKYGPQSFQDKRSLTTKTANQAKYKEPFYNKQLVEKLILKKGRKKTFTISIYTRKNTEWQGGVFHDATELGVFSTIIELTNLVLHSS